MGGVIKGPKPTIRPNFVIFQGADKSVSRRLNPQRPPPAIFTMIVAFAGSTTLEKVFKLLIPTQTVNWYSLGTTYLSLSYVATSSVKSRLDKLAKSNRICSNFRCDDKKLIDVLWGSNWSIGSTQRPPQEYHKKRLKIQGVPHGGQSGEILNIPPIK